MRETSILFLLFGGLIGFLLGRKIITTSGGPDGGESSSRDRETEKRSATCKPDLKVV